MLGHKYAVVAAALAFGFVASAPAWGAPQPVDPGKVKALAQQIESRLSPLGCTASAQDDAANIEATIAASGEDQYVVRAALNRDLASPSLCPDAKTALASVEQTIDEALQGNAVPHSGGPTGGLPIGVPATYVSGGGSDYVVH